MTEILVVDDLRSFPGLEAENTVTYARTSAAAVAILSERHAQGQGFDEVWFDHDLGEETGSIDDVKSVVDWFQERYVWDDPPHVARAVVHTSNPVGADMIMRALSRYLPVRRVDALSEGAVT